MSPTRSTESSSCVKRTDVRSDMRSGFPDIGQVTVRDYGQRQSHRGEGQSGSAVWAVGGALGGGGREQRQES